VIAEMRAGGSGIAADFIPNEVCESPLPSRAASSGVGPLPKSEC
jgi:hypothetical protein